MVKVDPNGDWRGIGDTTAAEFEWAFREYGSAMTAEAEACHAAASPHSAVLLFISWKEQKHATWKKSPIPAEFKNPLSLAKPEGGKGVDRWERFGSYAECFEAARKRITSATYKGGVYAETRTFAELIEVYAPRSENDTALYIRQGEEMIAAMPQEGSGVAKRGKVPKPPMMTRYDVREAALGGKNCVDGIHRDIIGSDHHTAVGIFIGTIGWFLNPYNGALADFLIGGPWDGPYNGVICRFIEDEMPVAPWANGTIGEVRPPFGDGLRFVQKYGYGEAINAKLRSIEWSDNRLPDRMDYKLTDPIAESDCFLSAYIHSEEAGQHWSEFDWYLYHAESGTSHEQCPGKWRWANVNPMRARTVEIMRAFQEDIPLSRPLLITYPPGWTGGEIAQPGIGKKPVPVPTPDPKPVPPAWAFDPSIVWPHVGDGAISRAWIEFGKDTGLWQAPAQPWNEVQTDGGRLFRFNGGLILRLKSDGKSVEVVKG